MPDCILHSREKDQISKIIKLINTKFQLTKLVYIVGNNFTFIRSLLPCSILEKVVLKFFILWVIFDQDDISLIKEHDIPSKNKFY